MNTQSKGLKPLITVGVLLILVACSSTPTKWKGADEARSKLTRLQSDPLLSNREPVATKEAELAVQAAEKPQTDKALAEHLVYMADRKVDIAVARSQGRLYEDQRPMLINQRETARLNSRTREANMARDDATSARAEAKTSRMNELAAQEDNADLQSRINELNAQETDRGLVVTLGDLLFASGKSDLNSGATNSLNKLAEFLKEYPDRNAAIEGHTDNVGSEDFNLGLSERRADKVKAYLVNMGIAFGRLTVSGKGEASPVVKNDSATGRQLNRRVEVIISNQLASAG